MEYKKCIKIIDKCNNDINLSISDMINISKIINEKYSTPALRSNESNLIRNVNDINDGDIIVIIPIEEGAYSALSKQYTLAYARKNVGSSYTFIFLTPLIPGTLLRYYTSNEGECLLFNEWVERYPPYEGVVYSTTYQSFFSPWEENDIVNIDTTSWYYCYIKLKDLLPKED